MSKESVVILHEGSIGDTVVILPLLPWIRRAFGGKRIIFFNLGNGQISKGILGPTGLCDAFYSFNAGKSLLGRLKEVVWAWCFLRRSRARDLVWLVRTFDMPQATIKKLERKHRWFFRSAGVVRFWGMGRREIPEGKHRHVLSLLAEELRRSGLHIPEDCAFVWDYSFTERELERAKSTVNGLPFPVEGAVAVGCGGKQQACQWPESFWGELLTWLTTEMGAKVIFLGGPSEEEKIERLREHLPPGSSASLTSLSVRETILVLSRCRCYVGHDTGVIHMAASVGLRCFGIFSSHNPRRLWDPWGGTGTRHHVFRQDMECSPCGEKVCPKGFPAPCISGITPEVVKNEMRESEFAQGHVS